MPATLRAMDDQNHRQQAERLRALWKSGRDKYVSFFSTLNEVRATIGDEALPEWCLTELRIGISVIAEARRLLTAMDAEIVKADLAAARKAEKEQREAEAEARRLAREEADRRREADAAARQKAREEAERQRELEKAQHEARLAALKAETAEHQNKSDKVQHQKKTRERKRAKAGKESIDAAKRRTIGEASHFNEVQEDAEFARRYKEGDKLCLKSESLEAESRRAWVQGSVIRGMVLLGWRNKHSADRDFSEVLAVNGVDLSADDRAALLWLAEMGEPRMREILTNTESRSYQMIRRNHNKTTPRLVS